MRRAALALLALLLGAAPATRITLEDGSVRRLESVTRKHFGRRRVQLDVTAAPFVLVESGGRRLRPRAEYAGAVVLLRERPPWCDAEEYRALLASGALAVVREFRYFAPGRFYYLRDDDPRSAANRRAPLPWLDVNAADFRALAAALGRHANATRGAARVRNVTLENTPNPWVAVCVARVARGRARVARATLAPIGARPPRGRRGRAAAVSRTRHGALTAADRARSPGSALSRHARYRALSLCAIAPPGTRAARGCCTASSSCSRARSPASSRRRTSRGAASRRARRCTSRRS